MFYSQYVLAKKGALARIWLAAHWDRKLSKAQIASTDISTAVSHIIDAEVPMALRMSGHLLLGVARIFNRQVKYLLTDCSDALVKIKMAFRPGEATIDLAPKAATASYAAITLPETYGEFEITLPEVTMEAPDETALLDLNIARRREVTLKLTEVEEPREEVVIIEREDFGFEPMPMVGEEPEVFREDEEEFGLPAIDEDDRMEEERRRESAISEGLPTPLRSAEKLGQLPDEMFKSPGEMLPEVVEEVEIQIPTPRGPKVKPLQIDSTLILAPQTIKENLADTSDTIRELEPAPSSKEAMKRRMQEIQGPQAVFRSPIIPGLAPQLLNLFTRTMTTAPVELPSRGEEPEEEGMEVPFFEPEEEPVYPQPEEEGEVEEAPKPSKEEEEILGRPTPAAEPGTESWSERTIKMHRFLHNTYEKSRTEELQYLEMIKGKQRRIVAGTFFELLVLKSRDIIDLRQDAPYSEIFVKKTNRFFDVQSFETEAQ